jgi:hypothetical protein
VDPAVDEAAELPVSWHHEEPATIVLVLQAAVDRQEVPIVCHLTRVRLVSAAASVLVCDIGRLERPCVVLMDALARLRLITRRLEMSMHLRNAHPDMQALFGLAGLSDVLPQNRVLRRYNGASGDT